MIRLFPFGTDDVIDEALSCCEEEVGSTLPFEVYGNPFAELGEPELRTLAKEFAYARINGAVSPATMEFEMRFLLSPEKKPPGVVYDALSLSLLFLPHTGGDSVVVSRDLIASRDGGGDYHLRTAFFTPVVLISLPGLVEAPARKREFYLARRLGLFVENKDALKHNDVRIPKVLSGYLLQALFYLRTGEPFCEKKKCRLYNAHWQSELIEAQIDGSLCQKHHTILKELLNRHQRQGG